RRRVEPARQEEVDALVTEAGRGEDGPEVRELARLDACLLGQLARRARAGRLVGRVEDARRQLPDVAAGGVAVLADEHDAPVVIDRGQDRKSGGEGKSEEPG